jgi:signal transduction histidine kinase
MDTQALLDSLDLGVVVIAPDWTIAQWSAAAGRITGLSADRVVNRNFWVAFPTAKGTHIEQVLHEVLADGQPQTFLTPAGVAAFPTLVSETRVTRGPHSHLVLVFRQVREELAPESRSAQLLTASETERRRYAQLFSALPIPALVLTADGQILEANPEGAQLLGASDAAPLRGRPLSDWTAMAHRAPLAAALRNAVTQRQELQLPVESGDDPVRHVHAVVMNIDAAQASPQLVLLAVDVSRETLLQQRLLQADRLSQIGALVSGVAHELNNPLAAIAAFAELLTEGPHSADLRESAEIIRSEALRAGRIVGTLLDFARQRPRQPVAVDLAEVFERVLALQRSRLKKARVGVTVSVAPDLPVMIADPQELQQVVLNAIVNARQAIEGTGRPGQITLTARRTDHHIVATVDDTGPGVPPEILDRVFDPFFTTKGDAGTGLGLAISFGLVRAMGGRMWIQNVEGGGARLAFELPMEPTPPAVATATSLPAAARSLAVLVVEDEESVRRGMMLLAKRLGHAVTAVGGFAEATRRLAEPGAHYDVLLVDVHLEEPHTGFDLFEQLRLEGRGQERRIVFTTGDSISAGTGDRLELSERPVLRKPFSLDELREMLDRVAAG